ncbi:MAG: hypothetical protein NHG13_00380 [Candidatus Shikimatogenerans bostrichidophilus]|nr:MAG: hypothetical protein NHG13_00380 [Candidatus Shikimatogenerans bostrichidophilus]
MIKIIFMSNGYFGIPSLKKIIKHPKTYKILYIVTSYKKKINNNLNLIKKIAIKNKIKIIYSEYLEKKKNIKKLKKKKPDLFILISFKIIKKVIWKIPKIGTFNIHPSLLPLYKGPCPINWVIINNENYTGLTSFWINNNIDSGEIILQKKIKLIKNINYKTLFNTLSILCKKFLIKTINKILFFFKKKNKYAPKINNFYSKIYLKNKIKKINNLILGLPDYKPAWCYLNVNDNIYILYIFKIKIKKNIYINKIGYIIKKEKKIYLILKDGLLELIICQLNNKRKIKMIDIYNGLQNKKNIFIF